MKAIWITALNQSMLASRYNIDKLEYDERLPIGYILVNDFGDDLMFEIVTQEKFDLKYTKLDAIKNGFYRIEKI